MCSKAISDCLCGPRIEVRIGFMHTEGIMLAACLDPYFANQSAHAHRRGMLGDCPALGISSACQAVCKNSSLS